MHDVMVIYLQNDNNLEISRATVRISVWPPRLSDIEEIEQVLKKRYGYRKILIIGWYPLSPETSEADNSDPEK